MSVAVCWPLLVFLLFTSDMTTSGPDVPLWAAVVWIGLPILTGAIVAIEWEDD